MGFSQVKGNVAVCNALKGMVDSGKVPHAIMFHEDDGGGAIGVALAFLQYLTVRTGRRVMPAEHVLPVIKSKNSYIRTFISSFR